MNGWLWIALTTAMCVAVFANGVRFARMTASPFVGRRIGPFAIEGSELSLSAVRRIGFLQMIGAPVLWLFFTAMALGLFGPVDGIDTLSF